MENLVAVASLALLGSASVDGVTGCGVFVVAASAAGVPDAGCGMGCSCRQTLVMIAFEVP